MRIGLTGSTGMIGRHMRALLRTKGSECVCVSRKEWDLCDWKTCREFDQLFNSVDAVFHFGATLPSIFPEQNTGNEQTQKTFDANVRSCLNLAEWASLRKVPIVFLSGATVYADPHAQRIKENAIKVTHGFGGFYGYSKLLAERVFKHYIADGLELIILRPSSVYGVGLGQDKLVSNYLALASTNKTIRVDASDNRINLIHALDVSKAALSAFKQKTWGTYNVASDYAPSIQELAELSVKVCGKGDIKLGDSSSKPFLRFDLDTAKAHNTFMYKPTIPIEEGLALMSQQKEL